MRLQNDVQREIVRHVLDVLPTRDGIIEHAMYLFADSSTSATVRNWIWNGIREQINTLIEWSVIYEVEEDGEKMGYYQTDWTDEQIWAK